jgi:ADP-heptose:LPS heptosyltransferase
MLNIDIVCFQTFGDILECTPILRAIRKNYPDANLRWHVNTEYKELLELNPDLNHIVAYDQGDYTKVYQLLNQNFVPGGKSDFLCPIGMANHYDTCWHHNPESTGLHMMDWYTSRVNLPNITYPLNDYQITLDYNEEDAIAAEKLLEGIDKYAVIHTTSRLETKDWPIQFYNHLAIMLQKQYPDITLVQIGSSNDNKITMGNVKSLLGKTPFRVVKAIMTEAKFFVGGDSGNSYIAGSCNIPTFLVIGSTRGLQFGDLEAYRALNSQKQAVKCKLEASEKALGPFVGPIGPNVLYIDAYRPISCQPVCVNHCTDATFGPIGCIKTIQPEMVFDRIVEKLKT